MKAFFIILFTIPYTSLLDAQSFCRSVFSFDFMNINAVNARVDAAGNLFYDEERNRGLEVFNEEDSTNIHTIYQAGLVLGALDETGEPHINWRVYAYQGAESDNATGHLNTEVVDSFHCEQWNQIWRVSGRAIRAHLAEIAAHGMPQIRRAVLYDYPAIGNPFFSDYHDFSLPINASLAPFYDQNNDGRYNPDDGDFPLPANVNPTAIPDLMFWSVYNDVAPTKYPITYSLPLGVEIQQTTFAYACSNDKLLDKTIFTQHKIINKSDSNLDSLFIGNRFDFDIGNFADDCIGTASELNTMYGYNCDEEDGAEYVSPVNLIPNGNIPVQAITFLNQTLDRTRVFYASGVAHFASHFIEPFYNDRLYHALNGNWSNGMPLTFGGNGYQKMGGEPTHYIFPDNPNDINGWSMLGNIRPHTDYRGGMTNYVGNFPSGAVVQLDQAWSFHRGENDDHLSNVDLMYEQVPLLQEMYDEGFANIACLISNTNELVKAIKINVFPNPTANEIQILTFNNRLKSVQIFDSWGQLMIRATTKNIDLADQVIGVYFLLIEMENGQFLQEKIVKL